jgi:hypothetical protein
MKTLSLFASLIMMFSFSLTNAQVSSHRGVYPRLLEDGKIVDINGKKLGSIRADGKVIQNDDKVIAIISSAGEVSYANGHGVAGTIEKNVFTSADSSYVATIQKDGAVFVDDDFGAFVDRGYPTPSFGCILHFFFSSGKADAKELDALLY